MNFTSEQIDFLLAAITSYSEQQIGRHHFAAVQYERRAKRLRRRSDTKLVGEAVHQERMAELCRRQIAQDVEIRTILKAKLTAPAPLPKERIPGAREWTPNKGQVGQ